MLTFEKYNCIKILLQSGASIDECAKSFAVTDFTIMQVKNSKDYEEYKDTARADQWKKRQKTINAKKETAVPQQVVEYKQSVTVQTTHYVETKIDKMIEILTVLNNKIGYIVDELAGVKPNDK